MGRRQKNGSSENKEDLTLLPNITEDDIVSNLRDRFTQNQPCTNCGASSLVYINPMKSIESFSDASLQKFTDYATDLSGEKLPLPSHIFQLAASAFLHMIKEEQDQSIILSGESGSGKTEARKLIVRQLCALSKSSKKKSRVISGVTKMETALEAFGSARTTLANNSSRYGRYTEYQFNAKGKLVGARTLDYMLEKARVTRVPVDERNFNAFYYLLAGSTPDERAAWKLADATNFVYLESKKFRQEFPEDSIRMSDLRDHLKSLGIGQRHQTQIFQLLAAILHIGNIQFFDDPNKPKEACGIKNYEQIQFVSELLGVNAENFELALTNKTKMVKRELCQVFLDAEGASGQRDALAQTLYSLLFGWIVEHINTRLDTDDYYTFTGVVDQPGFQDHRVNGFETLVFNYVNERLHNYINHRIFEEQVQLSRNEGLTVPPLTYGDNSGSLQLLAGGGGGLRSNGMFAILEAESSRSSNPSSAQSKKVDNRLVDKISDGLSSNPYFVAGAKKMGNSFGIKHYAGVVDYDARGFIEKNTDTLCPDFVSLFRGNDALSIASCGNPFYESLFSEKVVYTEKHALHHGVLVAAHQTHKPLRRPSTKRKKGSNKREAEDEDPEPIATVAASLKSAIEEMIETLKDTQSWNVYCVRPNEETDSDRFDARKVKAQVRHFGIPQLAAAYAKGSINYTSTYGFDRFLTKYKAILDPMQLNGNTSKAKCEAFATQSDWTAKEMAIGSTSVLLAEASWRSLEDELENLKQEQKRERACESTGRRTPRAQNSNSTLMNSYDAASVHSDDESEYADDATSTYESEFNFGASTRNIPSMPPMPKCGDKKATTPLAKDIEAIGGDHKEDGTAKKDGVVAEFVIDENHQTMSPGRKKWVCLTWTLTWWIPDCCLSACGGMKRKDIQMAWREKLALCLIIFLLSAIMLFYIVGLGRLICPTQQVLSSFELASKQDAKDVWVSAYGRVFQINELVESHFNSYGTEKWKFAEFLGQDVSDLFYKNQNFAKYCPGMVNQFENGFDNLAKRRVSDYLYYPHRGRDPVTNTTKLYLEYMNQYAKYRLGWTMDYIAKTASQEKKLIVIYDNVYDVSTYFNSAIKPFGATVAALFSSYVGTDITDKWRRMQLSASEPTPKAILNCMNNLFYIGTLDRRNEFRCQFSNYILLASTIIVVSVIGFKFLAALQFGGHKDPEEHDKFVICQVPCYTEGPESLAKTLESLGLLRYDDKRTLLFIICDGMIIGSGNDRPTPRIVLDILGVDPNVDPEAKAFLSLGEGDKQLNMAKIYSGLYEVQGRSVPFIVYVKVGKPTERQRPGNRGKRDSQMVLMRFLSKVHFNSEMTPSELELYHHMKNIIGVNPSFYEYVLMVDADTEVMPDSLNRMISAMIHDSKIMGICGETLLSNEKDSWITMIQVYEYFISHHLAKSFESLFGSVTCLPGCFCMYRVRTPSKNIPLLVAPGLIEDYAENNVNTLHLKNLLHLGEDRYLTTLLMKHFPNLKLCFTPDAQCRTNAPDRWAVLLSQRRRWINSTVHNLLELLMLPQLCGFCCFSMRFIVFLDLFSTVVQPAGVLYIGYLIYTFATSTDVFPTVSIVMLAAIYGFQVVIFILKRQWAQIGWMVVYMLATPVFGFYIPLYAFWHFDDFSWGNTRVVVGEGGKKMVFAADQGAAFDPVSIPLKKWADYEQELYVLNAQQAQSLGGDRAPTVAGSVYGGNSIHVPSVYGVASVYGGGLPATIPLAAPSMYAASAYGGTGTHYAGSVIGGGGIYAANYGSVYGGVGMGRSGSSGPTDEELMREIRRILSTANLMTITKKQVRDELTKLFGVDLMPRKAAINSMIEQVLQSQE
ncbi:chitin synthase-domain-containing protein [Cladochytrium replicatum]|nr:chitin synthase-domain-containing protein [Cladochytrium replicatum]